MNFTVLDDHGVVLFVFGHSKSGVGLRPGQNHLICTLPEGFLNIGTYFLTLHILEDEKTTVVVEPNFVSLQIQEGERAIGQWMGREPGFIKPRFQWSNE